MAVPAIVKPDMKSVAWLLAGVFGYPLLMKFIAARKG